MQPAASRRFVARTPGAAGDAAGGEGGGAVAERVRVLQYNTLAQVHCEKSDFGAFANQYTGVSKGALAWPARFAGLAAEVEAAAADVVALQEVDDPAWQADWLPLLGRLGYRAVRGSKRGHATGAAVCWRDAAFDAVADDCVAFADAAGAAVGSGLLPAAAAGGRLVGALQSGSGGSCVVMVLLRRRGGAGPPLAACSAHLLWDFARQDVKTAQAAMCCRAVHAFARRHAAAAGGGAVPVMLAGDFNSIPSAGESRFFKAFPGVTPGVAGRESFGGTWRRHGGAACAGVYRLLEEGALPAAHPEHPAAAGSAPGLGDLTQPLRLRSAYKLFFGKEPESTNRCGAGPWWSGCLDYIWVGCSPPRAARGDAEGEMRQQPASEGVAGGSAAAPAGCAASGAVPPEVPSPPGVPEVLEVLEMPYPPEPGGAARFGPIPNVNFPSDHLALGATLSL